MEPETRLAGERPNDAKPLGPLKEWDIECESEPYEESFLTGGTHLSSLHDSWGVWGTDADTPLCRYVQGGRGRGGRKVGRGRGGTRYGDGCRQGVPHLPGAR